MIEQAFRWYDAVIAVAALAQIIAAMYAYRTFEYARKTVKQADDSRIRALSPGWECTETPRTGGVTKATFYNVGPGSARDCKARLVGNNGQPVQELEVFSPMGNGRVVIPDNTVKVTVVWPHDLSTVHYLILQSQTNAGNHEVRFEAKATIPRGDSYPKWEFNPVAE